MMSNHPTPQKSHAKLIFFLMFGVLGMFGFCYLLVPIYSLLCKQIGMGKGNSTAYVASAAANNLIDYTRNIKVGFTTIIHGSLKFQFVPITHYLNIHPGEVKPVYFLARNRTGKDITVQAIPSITPADAARFLKKTECFCFTQQYFTKDQKAQMPVFFFIDPSVSKNIKEITLSYTLFDATGFEKKYG